MNNINNLFKNKSKTFQISNKDNKNMDNILKENVQNLDEEPNKSDIFVYKYNSSLNNSENIKSNKYKNNSEIISQKLKLLNSNSNILFNDNMINSEQNFPYDLSLNNFNQGRSDINSNYQSDKIKSQIEKAAKNMMGDMSQIISSISNEENDFKNKCSELEIKYSNRLKEIEFNKNDIISNLKNKIREMKKHNEQLQQDLNSMEQDNILKCQELTKMISTLKNNINNKEEEIFILKKEFGEEEKIEKDNNENDINNLCYLYEEKINNILNISDERQKELLNIIKEKEEIIQELINANQNKTFSYNNLINKFQRENDEFKNVTQKSIFLAGNNIHKKFLNELGSNNYKYQEKYYK